MITINIHKFDECTYNKFDECTHNLLRNLICIESKLQLLLAGGLYHCLLSVSIVVIKLLFCSEEKKKIQLTLGLLLTNYNLNQF